MQELPRSGFHVSLAALLVLLAWGVLPARPVAAEDRTHVVEWIQPDGPLAGGFLVELGTQSGAYPTTVDLGPVDPQADGVCRANLVLDAFTTYYLRVVAYNTAGTSLPSEEGTVPALICYPAFCDDGNECTADACDASGCTNVALADGSACSDGMCVAGRCEPIQCLADSGCDDGNVCNGAEFCAADGLCGAGLPLSCGEPTACTAPTCDPVLGCLDVPLPDGTPCDDELSETGDDVCLGGTCQGTAAAPEPRLSLESITPAVVSRGRKTIEVYGSGFMPAATLSFENGAGKPPKVKALRIADDGLLVATVEVSGNGPPRARYFDVRVKLPDGSIAELPKALRVDP